MATTTQRDRLLTTYLGATECIASVLRRTFGSLLPGWLRRKPHDWRAFAGKAGRQQRTRRRGSCHRPCQQHPPATTLPPVQVCVVTGGATNIGFAISQALAEAGAHVILACR
jgi:hypothetical protein